MGDIEIRIRCQRCGSDMTLQDPLPGTAWKPDQFWVCPQCGRHFWTTYPSAKPDEKAAAEARAKA